MRRLRPRRSLALCAFAAFAATLLAGSASAQTYNGDTTGKPTWQRPLEGATFTGLSSGATAVRYEHQRIQVATTGSYTLTASYTGFDGFLFVYQTDFNPLSQGTSYVFGDDDFGASGSQIVTTLTGGTEYLVIATAFSNTGFGAYSLTITGPAAVTFVGPPAGTAPPPSVTTATPASGLTSGGEIVTVQGSGFFGVTSVSIGGNAATAVNVLSDTRIRATTPAGVAGAADVVVTASGGVATGSGIFTYLAPAVPAVTAVSPSLGLTTGGDAVTITGTGFLGATAVSFGATAASAFTVVSDTQINATTAAAAAATVDVTVTGPGGSGVGTALFSYVAPVTTQYAGSTTGKPTWTRPNVNGAGAFTSLSTSATAVPFEAQQLTVATAGRYTITGTWTSFDGFLVVYQTSFDPVAQSANFVIGDDDGTSSANSQVSVTLSPGTHFVVATGFSNTAAGNYSMSISGVAAVALVGPPAVVSNPPDITSIAPTTGSTAGGTAVTITGTGFTGTSAVSFGGAAATTFAIASDTSITATTPAAAAGAVDVVVTNSAGSDTLVGGFTYVAPVTTTYSGDTTGKPTWARPIANATTGAFDGLSGLGSAVAFEAQEMTVATSGVYTITASWSGYDGYLFVYQTAFDPLAQSANYVIGDDDSPAGFSESEVSLNLTAGTFFIVATGFESGLDEGPYDVEVVGPAAVALVGAPGGAPAAPTVTAIAPNQGTTLGGTAVAITGAGFTGATAVTIGGAAATSVVVASDTSITAVTPAGTAGVADVAVTTPGGTGTGTGLFTFVAPAAPTVTAVSPDQGSALGGTAVTITGTGFTGATAVTIGGAAAAFSVTSDTTIAATTPAGAAGAADIAVTANGLTGTGAGLFTYVAGPATLVTTYRGDTTGQATWTRPTVDASGAFSGLSTLGTAVPFEVREIAVTTSGTYTFTAAWDVHDGFLFLYQVAFSPTAQSTNFVSGDDDFSVGGASAFLGSQVTATLTAGTAYFVVATGFDNVEEGPYALEVAGPDFVTLQGVGPGGALQVTEVQPDEGSAAGGTQVTIIGAGFTGATAVEVDGVAATSFTVRSDAQINATTPPGTPGPASVVVRVGAASSNSNVLFTYTAPIITTSYSGDTTGKPTWNRPDASALTGAFNGLSSFDPPFEVQELAVTTTGSYTITASWPFDGYLFVYETAFDPLAQDVNYVLGNDDTGGTLGSQVAVTLTAGTPYFVVATAFGTASGPYTIDIAGPDAVGLVGPPGGASAPPTLTSISPTSGTTLGGTSVTIAGTNLTGATAVTFGGAAAQSFTVNGAAQITAVTPSGTGVVDVAVTTPGGSASLPAAFTYVAPAPTVTAISPDNGPTTGGTAVTITGTAFTGATAVTIGGTAVVAFTVVSDTTLTTVTPAGSAGVANVTVTTAAGTGTGTGIFTYVAPPTVAPTVTAINPATGPTAGGTSVTITGAAFTGATGVTIGGAAAASVVVVNDTTITAVTPAGTGTANVVVTTAAGSGTGTGLFTYVVAPTVTAVNPTSGPSTGGTVVTITGAGFTGATAVRFGVNAATAFTVNSANQITATTPPGTAGAFVSVEVTTAGGTNAPNALFSYVAPPAPTVTTYTGTTIGAPTWLRPLETNTGMSGVGTAVPFHAQTITVNVSGSYTIDGDWSASAGYDGFLFVYETPFNAAATAPQATFVAGDDDGPGGLSTSQVIVSLTAGTDYVIVATGFDNTDAGDFTITISGPAAVVLAAPTVTTAYSDDTTGAPVWNRPDVDAAGALIGLSAVGDQVPFHVQEIDVAQAGSYRITADWTDGQDGYLLVYDAAFDAADPLADFLAGNDDAASLQQSEVTAALTAGGSYFIVATGFTNADFGSFDLTIRGPAAVTLVPRAPAVTAVTPPVGLVAGGTFVTVVGVGFTGATDIKFGGVSATNLAVLNDRKLTCTTPSGTAGPVDVEITAPAGTSAAQGLFTYVLVTTGPLVTAIAPGIGPEAGGTAVTITGINFTGASAVRFGASLATNLVVVSDTSITCTTPAGSGTVGVEVTTPFGVSPATTSFAYLGSASVSRTSSSGGGGGCSAGAGGGDLPLIVGGLLIVTALSRRRRARPA